MKYLLIVIVFLLSNCSNSEKSSFRFSKNQESDLMYVIHYFNKLNFYGSITIKNKEIRNRSAEMLNINISDSIFVINSRYKFTSIISEPEFTYFIIDGFTGKSFGLLFTSLKKEKIKNFSDIQMIKKSKEDKKNWYFVNSRLW